MSVRLTPNKRRTGQECITRPGAAVCETSKATFACILSKENRGTPLGKAFWGRSTTEKHPGQRDSEKRAQPGSKFLSGGESLRRATPASLTRTIWWRPSIQELKILDPRSLERLP